MLKRVGGVGVHIAHGVISSGKSNAAKVALSVACGFPKRYMTSMTDSVARSLLKDAMPFVYDDPSNKDILRSLLMNSFGGAGLGTARGQFSARNSPLVTANEEVLEELAEDLERLAGNGTVIACV